MVTLEPDLLESMITERRVLFPDVDVGAFAVGDPQATTKRATSAILRIWVRTMLGRG
jgi:hypothetical protein